MPKKKEPEHKDLAYPMFRKKMEESWTYAKLSDQEKQTLDKILNEVPLRGNYQNRYDLLVCVYNAFIYGAGYIDYC